MAAFYDLGKMSSSDVRAGLLNAYVGTVASIRLAADSGERMSEGA
jgi:hypothetical protein